MEEQNFKLQLADLEKRLRKLSASGDGLRAQAEIEKLRIDVEKLKAEVRSGTPAWERTKLARHDQRPYTLDYIERIFDGFTELHGDRRFADDPAIVAGMAFFQGRPAMVIGHQKGRDLKQRLQRNYGMAQPEGYRKALRLMKVAEKFNRPVFTFIDTPGAYPGIGAEERGIAEAIAYNLREMARLRVPLIVTIIGEGGSGGALGIAVGDRVLMLENAIYSVISPESCSAILWRDQEHAEQAAEALRLTADSLLDFKIIDEIVPEPPGGAHMDCDAMAKVLSGRLAMALEELLAIDIDELIRRRYLKFRRMGEFEEALLSL